MLFKKEIVEPEPDEFTKPENLEGFCFGYVCFAHHVQNTFETLKPEYLGQRKVCNTCGELSRPAIVKRIAEPRWEPNYFSRPLAGYAWRRWSQFDGSINWNKFEFRKFLEE